ncbi:MAG: hypothetical protein JRJ58_09690 [Deltaproteobacteria bacterium]|nr:hypothetical protein [Deltaproteobacteria bacterium]
MSKPFAEVTAPVEDTPPRTLRTCPGAMSPASVLNSGTINIDQNTRFNKSSGQHTNEGDLNLAAGKTLTISGLG